MAVYNLAVDDVHEYFANGVLVANCSDASLYQWRHMSNWLARPDVAPKTSEERLKMEEEQYMRQQEQAGRIAKGDDLQPVWGGNEPWSF